MRMGIETAARTPMQNRKVHAESDFGIRIRETMIQVCEFGKGTVKRKPKDFKWLKSDSQIEHFQFFQSSYNQRRMKVSGTRTNLTEPNQALQRMNCIVTDRAPSSTLRANAVHR
jgi:hypothetical protein